LGSTASDSPVTSASPSTKSESTPATTPALVAAAAAVATPAASSTTSPTDAAFPMTGAAQAVAPPPKKKGSRPFIPALDSTRFFLISYIAVGHFIACCTKNKLALAMLSQVNVVVGAFFVLSGYVVAYTCTELGKYEASPRIAPANQFIMVSLFLLSYGQLV